VYGTALGYLDPHSATGLSRGQKISSVRAEPLIMFDTIRMVAPRRGAQ